MCRTSVGNILGKDYKEALKDGTEINFQIVQSQKQRVIPQNYFCRWDILVEKESTYQLSIQRNYYPILEQLELNIVGNKKQQLVRDNELVSTDPDIEFEKYTLVNTEALQIFARNKDTTNALQTFQIKLRQEDFEDELSSGMQ